MKYQNLISFKKHLVNSSPANLCRQILIAVNDDFERARAIDLVLSFFPGSPLRFSGLDCDLAQCLDAMHSMSLFGEQVVIIDEVEKLTKKQVETLLGSIGTPASAVIFATRSKTPLAAHIEKEGVILDLLEEKPWDREKRLTDELIERAKGAGKQLAPDAVSLLLERIGIDPAQLRSEIDKLICYCGARTAISRDDILAISPISKNATLWQTAEDVIWEGGSFPSVDSAAFHGLIPALRGQLHLGLTLATLIAERRPSEEWSQFLPKLWPKTLEKRSSQAARLGAHFFQRGLNKLFEIELTSRSNSTQYRALLDLFRGHLYAR